MILSTSQLFIAQEICKQILRNGFEYWWAPDQERLTVIDELVARGIIKFRDKHCRGEKLLEGTDGMPRFLALLNL